MLHGLEIHLKFGKRETMVEMDRSVHVYSGLGKILHPKNNHGFFERIIFNIKFIHF